MAKEFNRADRRAMFEQLLAELRARPEGAPPMSTDEWLSYLERIPPRDDNWSSADLIRELRGPLPADDPDFPDDRR
jgi:hypothetical protein